MACCLPTCAQGSSAAVTGVLGMVGFWAFWVLLRVLCMWGCWLCWFSPSYLQGSAYRWTRPSGGGRWGHNSRDPQGVHWCARKCAPCMQGNGCDSIVGVPHVPALVRPPCLHGYDACMVLWTKGASWKNSRQKLRNTFPPDFVFLFSRNSLYWWWSKVIRHLWIGRALPLRAKGGQP